MTDIVKFQQPLIVDDGTAPEYHLKGVESVRYFGSVVEVTWLIEEDPGRVTFRMPLKAWEKFRAQVEQLASGKSADVITFPPGD